MRKATCLIASLLIAIIITSCDSMRDNITGTWEYNETLSPDDNKIEVIGVSDFDNNGTYKDDAKATSKSVTDVDGYSVGVEMVFTLSIVGDWELNDKEIALSPTSCNLDVTSISYYDPESGAFIGNLTGREFEEIKNEFIQELKADMMKASTERIIMSQENKFVTESVDEDGGKITCTYKRVK